MGKVIEFDDVYLELPDSYMVDKSESEQTPRLSLEELQEKLEQTQTLQL